HAQGAVKSPFDVAFGPQEDGTFGAIVKGSTFKSLRRTPASQQSGQLLSLFAGVEVDGSWNSATDARNNASIAVRPSLALQKITPVKASDSAAALPTTSGPWLHVYFDVRQRFGDFPQTGAEARRVNQLILGGALQLRWVGFAKWYSRAADIGREDNPPTLTVGYYSVQKNNPADELLPDDFTADALQAKLSSKITLPICTKQERTAEADPNDPFDRAETVYSCPWGFVGELLATRSNGAGEPFDFRVDVGLFYDTGGDFSPVLRYRSGEEHGLQYDKQFLVGLLWQLPLGR
ncbi:MAG TPA: hypothetical protein VGC44_01660, partial [Longimicrobiales bacterium]